MGNDFFEVAKLLKIVGNGTFFGNETLIELCRSFCICSAYLFSIKIFVMAYPKKVGFDSQFELCSYLSDGFTHPVRIRILEILNDGAKTHGEISKLLPLHDTTVSHHLKTLVKRGFIAHETRYPHVYYRVCMRTIIRFLEQYVECIESVLGV